MNAEAQKLLRHYLQKDSDDARHSLMETSDSAVPCLIEEYYRAADDKTKLDILHVIAQHRTPEIIGFLIECLSEDCDQIWKAALDGLVTITGESVSQGLEEASADTSSPGMKREWILEAITQLGLGADQETNNDE